MKDDFKPISQSANQPAWYLDDELQGQQPQQLLHPDETQSPELSAAKDYAGNAEASNGILQDRFHKVLKQPMDRKKFLQTTGLAVLGVVGLGQLVKLLSPGNQQHVAQNSSSGPSYGSGSYGGTKPTPRRG
jgi:hypothetical protein